MNWPSNRRHFLIRCESKQRDTGCVEVNPCYLKEATAWHIWDGWHGYDTTNPIFAPGTSFRSGLGPDLPPFYPSTWDGPVNGYVPNNATITVCERRYLGYKLREDFDTHLISTGEDYILWREINYIVDKDIGKVISLSVTDSLGFNRSYTLDANGDPIIVSSAVPPVSIDIAWIVTPYIGTLWACAADAFLLTAEVDQLTYTNDWTDAGLDYHYSAVITLSEEYASAEAVEDAVLMLDEINFGDYHYCAPLDPPCWSRVLGLKLPIKIEWLHWPKRKVITPASSCPAQHEGQALKRYSGVEQIYQILPAGLSEAKKVQFGACAENDGVVFRKFRLDVDACASSSATLVQTNCNAGCPRSFSPSDITTDYGRIDAASCIFQLRQLYHIYPVTGLPVGYLHFTDAQMILMGWPWTCLDFTRWPDGAHLEFLTAGQLTFDAGVAYYTVDHLTQPFRVGLRGGVNCQGDTLNESFWWRDLEITVSIYDGGPLEITPTHFTLTAEEQNLEGIILDGAGLPKSATLAITAPGFDPCYVPVYVQ